MKSVIRELWYGNIHPHERAIKENTEYDQLRKELSALSDGFFSKLSDEQKEQFETISSVIWKMAAIGEAEAFAQGFHFGFAFTQEASEEYNGQFELI